MDTKKAVEFFWELRSHAISLQLSAGMLFRQLERKWAELGFKEQREILDGFNSQLFATRLSTSRRFISSPSRLWVLKEPFIRVKMLFDANYYQTREEDELHQHVDDISAGLLRFKEFLGLFSKTLDLHPESFLSVSAELLERAREIVELPSDTGVEFERLGPKRQAYFDEITGYLLDIHYAVKNIQLGISSQEPSLRRCSPLHTAINIAGDIFGSKHLPDYEELESDLLYSEPGELIAQVFEEILEHYLLQGAPPQTFDEQLDLIFIGNFVAKGLQRLYVLGSLADWSFETLEEVRKLALQAEAQLAELSRRRFEDED